MDSVREQSLVDATLLCADCGQVIGVYEPLVHVIAGIAHKTSRAADPHLARSQADACYHLACRDLGSADLVTDG
jgi:hypothetical protein